jgi:hypothetical protein
LRSKLGIARKSLLGEIILQRISNKFWNFIGWADVTTVAALVVLTGMLMAEPRKIVTDYPVASEQQAQDNTSRIARLEGRVDELKDDQARLTDPVVTENRITRLESALDTIKSLLIGISTAVGLMLLESAHRLLVKKNP